MNHYLVLGVGRDAGADTIRSAFRAMARRYHPDAGQGSSTDMFRKIVSAYETLGDPARRRAYDRGLREMAVRRSTVVVEPLTPVAVEPLRGVRPASFRRSTRHMISPDDIFEAIEDLFRAHDAAFFRVTRTGR